MKTIRQPLCVRSLVLAIALASLLLLWLIAPPVNAQSPWTVNGKDILVVLSPGTDANGNPAAIATMTGGYWTTFPKAANITIHVQLYVDNVNNHNKPALEVYAPVLSNDPNNPTIITVA